MERTQELGAKVKVDVQFLTKEEEQLYRNFLRDTGRKAGPWVRVIILKAIQQEMNSEHALSEIARVMSGSTQIDPSAFRGAV